MYPHWYPPPSTRGKDISGVLLVNKYCCKTCTLIGTPLPPPEVRTLVVYYWSTSTSVRPVPSLVPPPPSTRGKDISGVLLVNKYCCKTCTLIGTPLPPPEVRTLVVYYWSTSTAVRRVPSLVPPSLHQR